MKDNGGSRLELFALPRREVRLGRKPRISREALRWILAKAKSSGEPMWASSLCEKIGADWRPGSTRLSGTIRGLISLGPYRIKCRYDPVRQDIQVIVK